MAHFMATSEQRPVASALGRGSSAHENRVLASLPPAEFAVLSRHTHVVSLQPGLVPQHQGRPLDYVYFPHDGLASLLAVTVDGATIEAASAGRGGALCCLLESDLAQSFLAVVAHGAMRASRIAAAQIKILERESEALNAALRASREALLLQLRQNMVCAGLHSAEQRLSRWLLEAADRLEAGARPISATQEQVAQRLGVRRTTVTLVASKLQDGGAIRWGRSRVDILDRRRLETMACGCYAALRERVNGLLPPCQSLAVEGLVD